MILAKVEYLACRTQRHSDLYYRFPRCASPIPELLGQWIPSLNFLITGLYSVAG
jgi:hypothetical protein